MLCDIRFGSLSASLINWEYSQINRFTAPSVNERFYKSQYNFKSFCISSSYFLASDSQFRGPEGPGGINVEIKKWNRAGFSLVELLITIIISSVLFAAVGMMIVYANQAWLKSQGLSNMLDDARVAKNTINMQTGGAVTRSYTLFKYIGSGSGTWPRWINNIQKNGFFYVDSTSAQPGVSFNTFDRAKNTLKLNAFYYDNVNSRVMYDYWYATTGYGNAVYGAGNSEILVNNATAMTVTPIGSPYPSQATGLQVQITQQKQLVQGSAAAPTTITTQFIINTRDNR